jgi:hypothetical protein
MRIAAGIILIIAAIFNVVGGAAYVLGGGAATLGGAAVEALAEEAGKEAGADAAEVAKVTEGASEVKGQGIGVMIFGLFLWAMFVLQIVAAVFLFISKSKMFIFVIAGLSIVAEILGMIISSSILPEGGGFGWTNLFGLVGGVLAFLGAAAIGKAAAAPAAPAAPQG